MVSKRSKPGINDPPPYRISFWLLLTIIACLFAGARQTRYRNESKVETASQEPVITRMKTAKTAGATVSFASRNQLPHLEIDNPWSCVLGQLMQDFQSEKNPERRDDLVCHFPGTLKTTDIPDVLAALKDAGPGEMAADLERQLIRHWANTDPLDVALWIQKQPIGEQRQIALNNLATVWANENLADAIKWGQSLPNDAECAGVLAIVANEAVRADPVTALQVAIGLPSGEERDELIRRSAMDWAANNSQDAVVWAEQIPDVSLRAEVLASESIAFAKQDPASAATLAVTELPPGRLLDNTIISIVERWAQQQPEAAGEWVAQFPETPLRTIAIENLISQWSQRDTAAAQRWVAAHP